MIAGKRTNHQDHAITPESFNTTKTIVNTSAIPKFAPPIKLEYKIIDI